MFKFKMNETNKLHAWKKKYSDLMHVTLSLYPLQKGQH